MYRFFYEHKSLFLWGQCSAAVLYVLNYIIVSCLVDEETAKPFSRVAVPFYIPISNVLVI